MTLVSTMVFSKPPVNAFNSGEWTVIARKLDELGADQEVRVTVIRAGVDVKELAADSNKIVAVNKSYYDTFKSIHHNPKPVIVAEHDFLSAGGIGISCGADIIVASG